MASITLEAGYQPRRLGAPLHIGLMLMVALAALVMAAHAVARHGSEAESVRQCIQNRGTIETWMNFDTGRQALICQVGGRFGIQIRKDGREITSFLKNKLTRIEQVYQYLLNRGYQFVH